MRGTHHVYNDKKRRKCDVLLTFLLSFLPLPPFLTKQYSNWDDVAAAFHNMSQLQQEQ